MERAQAIRVQRPSRWDQPLDASMSDADVAWLRTRGPFNTMNASSFPSATPLEGILRYDCRLHRAEPGEVIVREGDYGSSAYLVVSGSVRVLVDSLMPEQLGRQPPVPIGWLQAARRYLRRSRHAETRSPDQVRVQTSASGPPVIRKVDDRQAVFLQDFDAILLSHETVCLGPGELFGEVAAMYRAPRSATVIAETEAMLVEIRWQGLRILRRDRRFSETLDDHYRRHWLPIHLREVPLLRFLPEENLRRVVESTELRSFGRMAWNIDYQKQRTLPAAKQIETEPVVAHEGHLPTELLILRSGFGRVSVQHGASHRTTAYLGKGHFFGLDEILFNAFRAPAAPARPYQSSLRAVGFLDALAIPVESFAEDVLPWIRKEELPSSVQALFPQAIERRSNRRRRRSAKRDAHADRTVQPSPVWPTGEAESTNESTALLEFIVQQRLNNGRDAMVIDLHRCTRCDDCVTACSGVHDGNPRFVRQGPIHDRLQFVQACMHCTDPVCMIGCPTGAIARDPDTGTVLIHDPICIGCGLCAAACPYDTIRMAEVVDGKGRPYVDESATAPIRKATKCDQCASLPSGSACVAACPHEALVRIDLSEPEPLKQWLQKRS
ncbi:cyclic nucleotide-binding domain-containing protein [Roseiconus nitratireducens]|uniref:Cyclic nucleotide-binding domain-containing protein n=1 Tax=Roseiconus nitratireducens TaxID=2605748 RepID=A0A5M6D1I8_9BACT|nr:cyclic nucleotide-binding domain-containing protein [Roseiconus nitratireducens]KAA5541381.1 cyclic nucleotide-binding domain-containing protein [Roseiconus nitratireducens]